MFSLCYTNSYILFLFQGTLPIRAAESFSFVSSECFFPYIGLFFPEYLPFRVLLIFDFCSSVITLPLKFLRVSSDHFFPRFPCLIFSLVSSECLYPLLASTLFFISSGVCLCPSLLGRHSPPSVKL